MQNPSPQIDEINVSNQLSFFSLTSRYRKFILLGLILIAFMVRAYHLDYQSLWRDEVDAIRFSNPPFLALTSPQNIVDSLRQTGHNGPLYFVVLAGWQMLAGDSAFSIRYLSLIAGVLVVPLTECVARQLRFNPLTALVAAIFVATSPYFIWYAQEAKMYTLLSVLILVAVYTFHTDLKQVSFGTWGIFVLVTSLSFYVHILAPLMIVVYAFWGVRDQVWSLNSNRGQSLGTAFSRNWGWVIVLGVLVLPYLPLAWWQAPLLFRGIDSGHPNYGFLELGSLLIHLYSIGVLSVSFRVWAMGSMVVLVLFGIWQIFRAGGRIRVAHEFVLMWVVIPLLLVYLISLRVAVFEDRYLIYILPAFYMLAAYGLVGIGRLVPSVGVALLLTVLLFNGWAIWLQTSQIIKPDFRSAADYVASQPVQKYQDDLQASASTSESPIVGPNSLFFPLNIRQTAEETTGPAVLIQMPYLHHTFRYYYSEPYQALDGVWTNDNRSVDSVNATMAQMMQDFDFVYFVVAEEAHWDTRQLTRNWLETQAKLIDERHFVGVELYLYQLQD